MISNKITTLILAAVLTGVVSCSFMDKEDPSLPNIEAKPANNLNALPDFSKFTDVKEKKQTFFTTLYPIIEEENKHIIKLRKAIVVLQKQPTGSLQAKQLMWLKDVAQYYRVDAQTVDNGTFIELLEKVDVIPPSLALTQAAIESGWGSSRFSKQGNNLFGQWCFTKRCGMVPSAREAGKDHEVAQFESVNEAVRAYLKNLNTNTAYQKLRDKRAKIRKENNDLTGIALAQTLTEYSEEREKYITKVTKFINQNNLTRFTKQFEESLLL